MLENQTVRYKYKGYTIVVHSNLFVQVGKTIYASEHDALLGIDAIAK